MPQPPGPLSGTIQKHRPSDFCSTSHTQMTTWELTQEQTLCELPPAFVSLLTQLLIRHHLPDSLRVSFSHWAWGKVRAVCFFNWSLSKECLFLMGLPPADVSYFLTRVQGHPASLHMRFFYLVSLPSSKSSHDPSPLSVNFCIPVV